jgi:membrane protein DedA with SNARE-associated domain
MVTFSNAAAAIVDKVGVAGIGGGVLLNGLGVPGISEVLLPLGGVAVQQGRMDFWLLFAVAMVCQLVGVGLAYAIARYGGLALVERYGKYVLISGRELDAAERAFEKYGSPLVVFGAFTPGIQGFVGYAAGLARMNFTRFLVSVFVGKLVWIGGLLYLGSVLGDHLELIDRSIKQTGVVVLAALIVLGIWYVRRHRRHARQARALAQKEKVI